MSNKKPLIIIVLLLLVCCVIPLVIGAVLFVVNKDAFNDLLKNVNVSTNIGGPTLSKFNREPGAEEVRYDNTDLDFTLIHPKDWKVEEDGQKAQFMPPTGTGAINFEAFSDQSFSLLSEVNKEFCDSFERGFVEGLGADEDLAKQFDFVLFDLNGNKGCTAQGSIITGINQKYYVFLNNNKDKVYTIFYTATDSEEEEQLKSVMDTFDFE